VNPFGLNTLRKNAPWCVALLAIATTAFAALFTNWAFYDDEGYILWTLIHHSQGHTLYETIYTQYGPAFYLLDTVFRDVIPLPYTTDGQRWQTWLFWIGSSLLLLSSFTHLKRCINPSTTIHLAPIVSVMMFLMLFWHQERLVLEPGHPQIWCTLLISICICLLARRTSSSTPLPSWILTSTLGLISGTLIMIKPNVGILLLAALPAIFLWSSTIRSSWLRVIDIGYTFGVIAIAWLLTCKQLDSMAAFALPSLVTMSLLAIRATLHAHNSSVTDEPRFEVRAFYHLFLLSLSAGCTLLFFVLWSAERGISPAILKQALFGQHGALLELYFFPAIRSTLGWSSLVLLVALFAVYLGAKSLKMSTDFREKSERIGADFPRDLLDLKIAPNQTQLSVFFVITTSLAAIVMWLDAFSPLVHGLQPRGSAELLLALSPCIASGWLLLRLPNTTSARWPLVGLATIAAMQPLIAFPVPGTQLSLGTLPLLILLVDGARIGSLHLASLPVIAFRLQNFPKRLAFYRRLATIACLIPALLFVQRYVARESLGLPGALWLRLSESQTQETRQVIATIRNQEADAFVFRWHNRPSWYLWAQTNPPFEQLPPSWTYLISDERQREQLEKLSHFPKVIIIDEPYQPRQIPPPSPLHETWKNSRSMCDLGPDFSLLLWTPNQSVSSEKNRIE
jgi:hypothetical protein